MAYDRAVRQLRTGQSAGYLEKASQADKAYKTELIQARKRVADVGFPSTMAEFCVKIAQTFDVIGQRADYVMALGGTSICCSFGRDYSLS
ncbi:MAG: hypothetical protein U0175_26610 [Caldilineaceae bacterium]